MNAITIKSGSPDDIRRATDTANGWVVEIDRELANPSQRPPGDSGRAYENNLRAARVQLVNIVGGFTATQVLMLAKAGKNPAKEMIRKAAADASGFSREAAR